LSDRAPQSTPPTRSHPGQSQDPTQCPLQCTSKAMLGDHEVHVAPPAYKCRNHQRPQPGKFFSKWGICTITARGRKRREFSSRGAHPPHHSACERSGRQGCSDGSNPDTGHAVTQCQTKRRDDIRKPCDAYRPTMRKLIIPTALQVTVLTLSCSSPTPTPVSPDASSDVVQDTVIQDVQRDGVVGDVCVLPDSDPFVPAGFRCVARVATPDANCPTKRVCSPSECPAECEGCASPLFCIPDILPDGGRPDRCVRNLSCEIDQCGPGCRAVG
jgi:hypothetical protein